jgi:hypothetical protein
MLRTKSRDHHIGKSPRLADAGRQMPAPPAQPAVTLTLQIAVAAIRRSIQPMEDHADHRTWSARPTWSQSMAHCIAPRWRIDQQVPGRANTWPDGAAILGPITSAQLRSCASVPVSSAPSAAQ